MAAKRKTPDIRITPAVGIQSPGLYDIIASKEDKKEKRDGLHFWLKDVPLRTGMTRYMIPGRTSFIECNDGWYQVYLDGEKLHLRFSAERVRQMS